MPFDRVASRSLTILHEGIRPHVYPDSLGKLTVGIGCYLDAGGIPALFARLGIDFDAVRSGRVDMTPEQIQAVFDVQLDGAIEDARAVCPTFNDLPGPAQLVLVDQAFQLGRAGLARFKDMLGALERQDWSAAADSLLEEIEVKWDAVEDELLDSQGARQTPVRAKGNAALLRRAANIETAELHDLLERAKASREILYDELDLARPTSRDRETIPDGSE